MDRGREREGLQWRRQGKRIIPQFAGKMSRQNRVIRLANYDQMVAPFLNDHGAGLVRSDALYKCQYKCQWTRDPSSTGDLPSLLLGNDNPIMPPPLRRIQRYRQRTCEPARCCLQPTNTLQRLPALISRRLQDGKNLCLPADLMPSLPNEAWAKSRWNRATPTDRMELRCGSGGTGRRARLRILWPKGRGGSNPSFRTIFLFFS